MKHIITSLTNEGRMELRIRARKYAETLLSIEDFSSGTDAILFLYEAMIDVCKKKIGTEEASVVVDKEPSMSIQEAMKFEAEIVKHGIYKGKPMREVPYEWLCWMVDDNPLKKKIRRYLKSQHVKDRFNGTPSNKENDCD